MDLQQQTTQRLKFRSSLAWLRGVHLAADKAAGQLLEVPFSPRGHLKSEVVTLLTTTKCYQQAYHAIFCSESLPGEADEGGEGKETFWPLIHGMARHGLYVVEEGGQAVNHSALAQRDPLRESSHLAVLNALMTAYVLSVVTIPRVVRAVRQISAFNAAQELPSTPEEAVLLWLRKVSEAVTRAQQQQQTAMLQEADARQRRRNRVQLLQNGESAVARPRGLVEAVAGGQSLAALLVHYRPHDFAFQDFHFRPTQLTPEEAVHNLSKLVAFCRTNHSPHTLHINPDELVNKDHVSLLHTSVLALLARLYEYFESDDNLKTTKPEGQRMLSSVGDASHSAVKEPVKSEATSSSQREHLSSSQVSWVGKRSRVCNSEHKLLLPRRRRRSELSDSNLYTVGGMPAEQHDRETVSSDHIAATPLSSSPSSSSSPDLVNTQGGVTFNPPIISSKPEHSSKNEQRGVSLSSTSSPLITASVDRLGIRAQMKNGKSAEGGRGGKRGEEERGGGREVEGKEEEGKEEGKEEEGKEEEERIGVRESAGKGLSRREWNQHPMVLYPTSRGDSSIERSDTSTVISCTEVADLSNGAIKTPFSTYQPQPSTLFAEGIHVCSPEVRKSFTLDKQHTVASASKAGLPIIRSGDCAVNTGKTEREISLEDTVKVAMTPAHSSGRVSDGEREVARGRGKEKHESKKRSEISTQDKAPIRKAAQIRSEPSALTLPATATHPQHKCFVVFIPEDVTEEEIQFDRYLLPRVQTAVDPGEEVGHRLEGHWLSEYLHVAESRLARMSSTEREEVERRKCGWRRRIQEMKTSSQQPLSDLKPRSFAMSAQVSLTPPPSAVPVDHPASSRPQPKLTSTTSKRCQPVASMPLLNDPLTKLPLTPITTVSHNAVPLQPTNTVAHSFPHPVEGVSGNPWTVGEFRANFTPAAPTKKVAAVDLQDKRQQLLREKLEKRQRDRKVAKQQKKRASIKQDIRILTENKSIEPDAAGSVAFSLVSAKQMSHVSLSRSPPAPSSRHSSPTPQPTPFISHDGPECYVKPSAKSNRKLIRNALCHVCLAGEVNLPTKQRALSELDTSNALHFFVLFKHVISFKFRALYSYSPEEGKVTKIFGSGPKTAQEHMVDRLYKYNSGSKEFLQIHSHSFSLSVDAFTLKQEVWASRKSRHTAL